MIWKRIVNKQIVDVRECDFCPPESKGTGWVAAKPADDSAIAAFRNSCWVVEENGVIVQVHASPFCPNDGQTGWKRVVKDGPEVTAHQDAMAARMAEAAAVVAKRQAVLDQLAALPPEKMKALLS